MLPETLFDLILRGLFFFLLLLYTIYGIILGYHWFTYGAKKSIALGTMLVYLAWGVVCFGLMLPVLFL